MELGLQGRLFATLSGPLRLSQEDVEDIHFFDKAQNLIPWHMARKSHVLADQASPKDLFQRLKMICELCQ